VRLNRARNLTDHPRWRSAARRIKNHNCRQFEGIGTQDLAARLPKRCNIIGIAKHLANSRDISAGPFDVVPGVVYRCFVGINGHHLLCALCKGSAE
jgi:hypothetical protein